MSARTIPFPFGELLAALRDEPPFHLRVFLDSDDARLVYVAQDLIDYCQGRREQTDLQLSDSHELPVAQAVADELLWLEQGFDAEGLPFTPAERRFFELPHVGPAGPEAAARAWMHENGLALEE